MPWYIFLFIGTFDFGFLYSYALIATSNAARVSAVYCSASGSTCASNTYACTYYVLTQLSYMPNIGSTVTTCNASPVTLTISYPSPAASCPDTNSCTSVTVTYVTPQLVPIPGIFPGQLTITKTVQMRLAELMPRKWTNIKSGISSTQRVQTPRRRGGLGVRSRRGSTMIEFTLLGIPGLFICISVVMSGIDMWQFFTLSYAAAETTRFVSVHGATCGSPNSCLITRAQVAAYFESQALALNAASTVLKMTDGSGTITCNPVTSCPSSSTTFPATTNNAVGSNIVLIATYPISNPLFMFWPGAGRVNPATYTLGASSTQEILY